jgi:hypothetical protein
MHALTWLELVELGAPKMEGQFWPRGQCHISIDFFK